MKTINLKLYLMILIILIASVCLLSTAMFVLYQTHTKSIHEARIAAESIDKQLEVQLVFGIAKGFLTPALFPNFDFWKKSDNSSGLCVHFEQPDGKVVKRACRGTQIVDSWPNGFKKFYQQVFQLEHQIKRPVTHHNKVHGFVIISSSREAELARAWHDIKTLMKLSAMTVFSLCTLLYFAVDWAFRPARLIVSGLEKMAKGNLSVRLANYKMTEWQQTGQAINQLAENLQKTLADRNQLALKLVNTQEEERRYLTRELHDEFGQSLAGLSAIASSITQTAEKECPQLVKESQNVGRITKQMMELLKNMLTQLRPIDFDEFGLVESLHSMVTEWNTRRGGKIRYELDIIGNFSHLPSTVAVNVFRIVQECLTNVSKHSGATKANVKLEKINHTDNLAETKSGDSILLIIKDNGIAEAIELSASSGLGLLGMRERVSALGGEMTMKANKPNGLIVRVWLPFQHLIES